MVASYTSSLTQEAVVEISFAFLRQEHYTVRTYIADCPDYIFTEMVEYGGCPSTPMNVWMICIRRLCCVYAIPFT